MPGRGDFLLFFAALIALPVAAARHDRRTKAKLKIIFAHKLVCLMSFNSAPKVIFETDNRPSSTRSSTPNRTVSSKQTVSAPLTLSIMSPRALQFCERFPLFLLYLKLRAAQAFPTGAQKTESCKALAALLMKPNLRYHCASCSFCSFTALVSGMDGTLSPKRP